MQRLIVGLVVCILAVPAVRAQSIAFDKRDAEVWGADQTVTGVADGVEAGTLALNGEETAFEVADGAFAVPVRLREGVNTLVACDTGGAVCSDTLRWTLPYALRPEVYAFATVEGSVLRLHVRVLDNPGDEALTFTWRPDPDNPEPVTLSGAGDTLATASLPAGAAPGEYYFDLDVAAADGDTSRARTFVTVGPDGTVTPFDIDTDHAAWVDEAVLYEIFPRAFANNNNGRLEYIVDKLPELVDLGVNTIWLQPIHPYGDAPLRTQAYDVADYFAINPALGDEAALHALVEAAHAAGLRVLLDFVANHSAVEHPYARDAAAHGAASYYYDFYMREADDSPYAAYLTPTTVGEMTFVNYFYPELVAFDFDNPDVERFIIEASRYWIETFDIDGYRLDAVWGPHARDPDFTLAWRRALKRVKPEVLLLAEAKAPYSEAFEGTSHPSLFESFDVAYDWTDEADYISRWAFQVRDDRGSTIFNATTERLRSDYLHDALTNYDEGFPDGARILRYLENNDTPRFIENHTAEQTKMAAALMFAVPGIPMLYYGQEAGIETMFPSFSLSRTIRSYDQEGLYAYYQHLIRLRETFPAFTGEGLEALIVEPVEVARSTYAFLRPDETQPVVGVINMADDSAAAALGLPVDLLGGLDSTATYYLTDLFSGQVIDLEGAALDPALVEMPPYSTRLFVFADQPVDVPTPIETPPAVAAGGVALAPGYPNPFRRQTTIPFTLAQPAAVRLAVYDVLGREVALLADRVLPAGTHEVVFDAHQLPAGVYFCRLQANGRLHTRPLLRVK